MDLGPGPGFDFMFNLVPLLVLAGFIFVFGSIIYSFIDRAKDRTKPVIPVKVTIVDKRTHVWGDHSNTNYYVTFELENGERMELEVPDNEVGFLVEGDKGILSFQGKIFVSFKRTI